MTVYRSSIIIINLYIYFKNHNEVIVRVLKEFVFDYLFSHFSDLWLESFSGADFEKNAVKILANRGNIGLLPNLV